MKYNVIDLFCGAGGFSEGILQAQIKNKRFHIVYSSDINKQVAKTYKNRHEQLGLIEGINTHFELSDIHDLNKNNIFNEIRKLKKFKNIFSDGDIKIDVIFGGPPCQGFSLAGERKKNDPRNMLFKEYLRIIKEIEPNYVVIENVVGFISSMLKDFVGVTGKKYVGENLLPDLLFLELDKLGYNVLKPKILNASNYGVPQERKRAIFIASKKGLPKPKYPSQKNKKKVTLENAIGDLLNNKGTSNKYQLNATKGRTPHIVNNKPIETKKAKNIELSNHYKYIVERFSLYNAGEDTQQIRKRMLNEGIQLFKKEHFNLIKNIQSKIKKKYNEQLSEKEIINIYSSPLNNCKKIKSIDLCNFVLTKKNNRKKLEKNQPSPTVLTTPDDFISPFKDRVFSVREMARLQSFDDSFVFLGKRTTGGKRRRVEVPQYSQVGNAVPPLLAKAIAEEILRIL